jgi:hypothetical protein
MDDIVKTLSLFNDIIYIDDEPILSLENCDLQNKPWIGNDIKL